MNLFSKIRRFLPLAGLCLVLLLLPSKAYAFDIPDQATLDEIERRLSETLAAGQGRIDLSDLDIHVNMYSDGLSPEYQAVIDLCDEFVRQKGSFIMGDHREPWLFCSIDTEPTANADEFGVGENIITAVGIYYDQYYKNEDGTGAIDRAAADQAILTREYDLALAQVDDRMTDAEKALALYDYIIAVSNYPDQEMIDEQGIEVYSSERYDSISVFRDHISVCMANATAYCYLLEDCGIECRRVDSTDMNHSWAMVKLDGVWYHCDPTWDNSRYAEGYTANYDYNGDSWDIGAASHWYFLKSDEEMMSNLNHYNWDYVLCFKDKSQTEIPAADQSGNFDNAFFNLGLLVRLDAHVSWIDGYWYAPSSAGDQIVRCTFDGDPEDAEYLDLPEPNQLILGCYEIGGCLYVHTREAIWQYDPANGSFAKILEPKGGKGAIFSEMNTASGALNAVEIVPSGDPDAEDVTWTTTAITIPAEDLPALAEAAGESAPEEPAEETEPESAISESTGSAAAEDSSAAGEDPSAPAEDTPDGQTSKDASKPLAIAGLAIMAAAAYLITQKRKKS